MGVDYGTGIVKAMMNYWWKNDCPGNPNLYSRSMGKDVDLSVEFGEDGHVSCFKMLKRNSEKGFKETVHYIISREDSRYVTQKGTMDEVGEMSPEDVSDFREYLSKALRNMDKSKFCLMDIFFPGSASDLIAREERGKLKDVAYRELGAACGSPA